MNKLWKNGNRMNDWPQKEICPYRNKEFPFLVSGTGGGIFVGGGSSL